MMQVNPGRSAIHAHLEDSQRRLGIRSGGSNGLLENRRDNRRDSLDARLDDGGGNLIALLQDLDTGIYGGDARLHEVTSVLF